VQFRVLCLDVLGQLLERFRYRVVLMKHESFCPT
jgi:hypothetical protein